MTLGVDGEFVFVRLSEDSYEPLYELERLYKLKPDVRAKNPEVAALARRGPQAREYLRRLYPDAFDTYINPKWVSYVLSLVDRDQAAFDAAKAACAFAIEDNISIPKPLQDWLVQVILDRKTRPKARGRKKQTNLTRNLEIVRAVAEHVAAGLSPTRNEASDPHSACDLVANARRMKYETVVKIWSNHQASIRTADDDARYVGYGGSPRQRTYGELQDEARRYFVWK